MLSERLAGLAASVVEWLGLTCFQLEIKRSSQYSAKLRKAVKTAREKFKIDENKTRSFQQIISSAHSILQFNSIEAKHGYKSIK